MFSGHTVFVHVVDRADMHGRMQTQGGHMEGHMECMVTGRFCYNMIAVMSRGSHGNDCKGEG